ncbi:hypothetical protein MPSEU_000826000 [Mayamaea pseudoterrestris]|nr:hypothetical protein MPSEU_000826000 [Mayamaea pseudoterrestris]
MVRPRLVEEGVPVGSNAIHNVENEVDDHSMADDDDNVAAVTHRQGNPSHRFSHQATGSQIPKSSLQVASGGKSFHTRPKRMHATHVVIGGTEMHDDDDMNFAQHHDNHGQRHNHPAMHPTHFQIPCDVSNHVYQSIQAASLPLPAHHSHHNHQDPLHHTHAAHVSSTAHQYSQPYVTNAPNLHYDYSHIPSPPPAVRTHYEIGADDRPTERMVGVEDHSVKPPLVVFDGANVAYAYAQAMKQQEKVYTNHSQPQLPLQPNVKGILVASEYFVGANMRVLIVLPQSWLRTRTIASNGSVIYEQPVMPGLEELQRQHIIVAAPPTDDDDAYAITIARRETMRVNHHHHDSMQGHGYVLSNDLFRDACARDDTKQLQEWLTHGLSDGTGAGRISYAFCDIGNRDDYGDLQLDLVPNPRHPLVAHIETQRLQQVRSMQQR